jgi:hypothetical protein
MCFRPCKLRSLIDLAGQQDQWLILFRFEICRYQLTYDILVLGKRTRETRGVQFDGLVHPPHCFIGIRQQDAVIKGVGEPKIILQALYPAGRAYEQGIEPPLPVDIPSCRQDLHKKIDETAYPGKKHDQIDPFLFSSSSKTMDHANNLQYDGNVIKVAWNEGDHSGHRLGVSAKIIKVFAPKVIYSLKP